MGKSFLKKNPSSESISCCLPCLVCSYISASSLIKRTFFFIPIMLSAHLVQFPPSFLCLWWKHKLAALCCPGAAPAAVNLPADSRGETERKRDLTVIMSLCVFWTHKSSFRASLLELRGSASCCWVLHNIWQELRHGQRSVQLRAESLDHNVDSSCQEGSETKHSFRFCNP